MAIFTDQDIEKDPPLDWFLLRDSPVTLYYRPAILEEDVAWLRARRYKVFSFDCARWMSEDAFHDDIQEALGFSDFYGRNLNAFNDRMRYLEIPDIGGFVLVFRRFDCFAEQDHDTAHFVLDVIASNSRTYALLGRRLIALVQSDDPRIEFEPVAACLVGWNSREWLNANRGL